jgi:hypothetical protein
VAFVFHTPCLFIAQIFKSLALLEYKKSPKEKKRKEKKRKEHNTFKQNTHSIHEL